MSMFQKFELNQRGFPFGFPKRVVGFQYQNLMKKRNLWSEMDDTFY